MGQKPTFGDMTTAQGWKPDRPYNDLPPPPPVGDLETKPVLKRCITARAALAELKQAAELIPNPAMLINTLPILEARASSEIENIVTTARIRPSGRAKTNPASWSPGPIRSRSLACSAR